MSDVTVHIDKVMQELRRGTITIGVLSQLSEPQYGYSLVSKLNDKGIQVEAGTLYPLLRRLEKQGLLMSEWDTNEARPRKYYLLSDLGKQVFQQLCDEWNGIVSSLDGLLKGEGGKKNGSD
ncbi:DNA-binding transcriptional regulator, PadR family [Oceanobacillus limi]|uniref:DNA-binding transcriptional regulator, PadR family n=1 Tax=Oceanobacillus limi TaxID=930131 RepID=A0A1I0B5A6_9BACI|nr:PadR family transcriptional regulator [Oceanobacillus limi]SET01179.1 DNA-binding transcriptional regulator, PadR family [Oceanobacillus limi]